MTFLWPAMLPAIVLAPLFVVLYLWIRMSRRRIMSQRGSLGLFPEAPGRKIGGRVHIPPTLFLAGFLLLLIALARPETTIDLPRREGTLILAFDTSGSMAAEDLAPNRLAAAKAAAVAIVDQQPPAIIVGVVSFSDSGFIVQPPTDDREAVINTIERLTPERGTSLARGILAALNTIFPVEEATTGLQLSDLTPMPAATPTPAPKGAVAPAVIVLLTDGENTVSPDPIEAALAAANLGVRIHTVGIGSPAGATLQIGDFRVHTQLDEFTLQEISRITGGQYFNVDKQTDMPDIHDDLRLEVVLKSERMEVTSLFAGAGVLLFLLGSAISMIWFGRLP